MKTYSFIDLFMMNFHQVSANSINYLLKAETSFLALWYFKLLLRTKLNSQNIWFFKSCLNNGFTTRYMKLKTDNKSSSVNKAIKRIRRWILEDMKIKCRKRDTENKFLKFIHSELLYRLHNKIWLESFIGQSHNFIELSRVDSM